MRKPILFLGVLLSVSVLSGCNQDSSSLSNSISSESSASSLPSSSESSASSNSSDPSSSPSDSSSSSESSGSSSSSEDETLFYSINVKNPFPTAGDLSEISSQINTSPSSYFDVQGLTLTSANATKIYAAFSSTAFKFASGSGAGSLTLNFTPSIIMTSVILTVSQYGTETAQVALTNGAKSGSATVSSGVTTLNYELGSTSDSGTLTLSSQGANRFYLTGILMICGTGTPSSSSSSSSSSESSSSSSQSSSSSSSSDSYSTSYNSGEYGYNHVDPNYSGTYYSSISDALRGSTLLVTLDDLLDADSASGFSYSGLFSVFANTDADPNNLSSGKILSFYSGTPSNRADMNREHTWPNSRGGSYVEDDPHVIRPTLNSENSARGNDFFNVAPTSWDPASFNNAKYRGIAARIIFYAAVKGQEDSLKLIDATTDTWGESSHRTMGKLSTLLEWNLQYNIDATEILRNDVLATQYGHNRNPFIDDRNYGCKIWGTTNATTRTICGM